VPSGKEIAQWAMARLAEPEAPPEVDDLSWAEFSEQEDITCTVPDCGAQAAWQVYIHQPVRCNHFRVPIYSCDPHKQQLQKYTTERPAGSWMFCSICLADISGVTYVPIR
jgi:hypothetical protein